ncbi:MAG: hypothetical protein DBX55_09970 [Verrucomicrobia bacterium]|nr:MAG: hypothetical protein DBX55_09970 [Verrucomicrobiota bacterium]
MRGILPRAASCESEAALSRRLWAGALFMADTAACGFWSRGLGGRLFVNCFPMRRNFCKFFRIE